MHPDIQKSLQVAASSMELHSPDQVAYVNVNNNKTTGRSEYQDLHQRPPENTGQYQELVTKQERQSKRDTSAKNSQVKVIDCKNHRCRSNYIYNLLASCLIIIDQGILLLI